MLAVLDLVLVLSNNINKSKVLRKTSGLILINGKFQNMPKSTKNSNGDKKKDEREKVLTNVSSSERARPRENEVENAQSCSSVGQPLQYRFEGVTDPHYSNCFYLQRQFYPFFPPAASTSFFQPVNYPHYNQQYLWVNNFHSWTNVLNKNDPPTSGNEYRLAAGSSSSTSVDNSPSSELKKKRAYREQMVLEGRVWEDVQTENGLTGPGFVFTLMTYNVLAQDLIEWHPYLYREHRQDDLDWTKRWYNLLNEFKLLDSDILCLQEVQESHLKEYYSQLQNLGYRGIFKKRTGERIDGCAIYYKSSKLKLLEYTTVEYYQPNVSLLNRDNIAIIAKFSPKKDLDKEFVVATTHLLYNPRRHDVRLAQTQLLLTEIERISYKNSTERYVPIIITGDFNSPPDTPLYEFITTGELQYKDIINNRVLVPRHLGITDSCQHAELLERRQNNEETNRTDELALIELHNSDNTVKKTVKRSTSNPDMFCSGRLWHHFPFKSVYQHFQGDDMEGTTFQDKWHTVDYIFYSGKKDTANHVEEDKLRLVARYRLPTAKQLDTLRIPSNQLGSDHLSLVARFKLEFS